MLEQCLVLAFLIESMWQSIKMIWQEGKVSVNQVGVLSIAILFSVATGTRLLEAVGLNIHIPYLDEIFTGVILSRGSNFVHAVLTYIDERKAAS